MTVAQISEDALSEYEKSMDTVARDFYEQLLGILNTFSKNGTLVVNQAQLAQLEAKIYEALKDADYMKATDKYLENFEKVAQVNKSWYKKQRINITDAILRKPQIEYTISQTVDGLRRAGVRDFMVKPIANILRQDVLLGLTYEATAEKLRKQTIGTKIKTATGETRVDDGYIKKYVKQVTRDALNGYSKEVNAQMIKEFGYTNFYYVGSLIDTSRPICIHLHELANGGTLTKEQIEKAVEEYCPNGKPSEEEITVTVNGITKTLKKGSGMRPGTTPENFASVTGGYECPHNLMGVRTPRTAEKKQEKTSEQEIENISTNKKQYEYDQEAKQLLGKGASVDKVYSFTKDILQKKGFKVSIGADSKTDWGHSKYLYVSKSDNIDEYKYKVRVSDHSVSNINRLVDEFHIHSDGTGINNAITRLEFKIKPELFKKSNGIDTVVKEVEVPAVKPEGAQVDNSYNKKTDTIISERTTKKGNKVYLVSRKYENEVEIYEHKETGEKIIIPK